MACGMRLIPACAALTNTQSQSKMVMKDVVDRHVLFLYCNRGRNQGIVINMLTIRSITNIEEFVDARKLMNLSFSRETAGTPEEQREDAQKFSTSPGFAFDNHHIGFVDDEMVAHVVTHALRLRYGGTSLQMGGIGAVCTHPDHRKKGYASAVMQVALDYMLARGDHFALLVTGTNDFYTKLGYHTLWPDQFLEVQTADAANIAAPLKLRPAKRADLPQIMALYDRHWGTRITVERPAEVWQWRLKHNTQGPLEVVEDRDGHIVAYRAGSGWIREWASDTEDGTLTLLAHAGKASLENGDDSVTCYLPVNDPIIYHVSRRLNCKAQIAHYPNSQWMGRIVNAEGFRDALLPEITRQAGLDERGFIFTIQPEQVYIGLRGQDETNVQLSHRDFLPMLFGTLPPSILNLPTEATQLLEALFPPRTALIAPWSSF